MAAPSPESLIDVVDDEDREVGVIARRLALVQGVNFRVAHIFITAGHDLLLQQLSATRDRNALRWGSSVAGYLHRAERYGDAAARRMREEVGLQLPLRLVGHFTMPDRDSKKFIALFHAELPAAIPPPTIADPGHIADLRFFPVDQLDALVARMPEQFTETFLFLYPLFRSSTFGGADGGASATG